MKHYHRNISRTHMQLWSSREYFQAEWRKLDPQPGDCFALFQAKDNFRGIILIEKAVSGWIRVSYQCKAIIITRKGFERGTDSFDEQDLESYSDIVQIDHHRFHVLDKPVPGYVVIGTTLPHAAIHNDGPTVSLKIPWEEPEKKKTSRRPVSKEEDKKRFEALMKRIG